MKLNSIIFTFLNNKKQQPTDISCPKLQRLPVLFLCFGLILALSLLISLPKLAFAQTPEQTSTPARTAEPYGFGQTGEPAPSPYHPGEQAAPWGPLINVHSGVVPSPNGASNIPPSPMPRDSSVNQWKAPKPLPKAEPKEEELVSWDLYASKVTGHNTNQILEAEGEVYLQRGQEYLKADYARYYAATGWVYLSGNVEVYFGKDRLNASEAEFDLANKVGWLKDGQVFMEGPHVYFSGSRVNKHWGDMYTFREAKVTTCDGDVPAWSMKADEAIVEIDGYARLWNTAFAVKDQNVAFSPYMILPAKKERQSGLLVPSVGQSTENGFMLNIPFFWAIDNSQDLTVNADIMTNHGVMMGAEYWARPDLEDQIWIRGDWLSDRDTSSSPTSNGLYRNNEQRFWLRGAYNGSITNSRWRMKANIDYTSDQEFLREFRNRPGGYNSNKRTMLDLFGRDMAPYTRNRVNEGLIYRDWERLSFYAGMRYEEDPALGHGNAAHSTDTIAQRLPEFNMYLNKGKIVDPLPLEISAETQAVNFYRMKGTEGMRFEAYPTLSVPLHTKYFSVEPSFSVRQTEYQTERKEYVLGDTGDNSGTSRTLPEFNIAAYSELARVYSLGEHLPLTEENIGKDKWLGMRHSIQPRIRYQNLADKKQADLPYYDYDDRRGVRNEVTYSLTNILGVHKEKIVYDEDKNPVSSSAYLDFVRFNLEHGFDFEEAQRDWDRKTYKRRPFMDVLADLTVRPGEYISFNSRTWFSSYTAQVTRHNNSVTFTAPGIGSLTTGLDVRDQPNDYWRWRKRVSERNVYMLHQGLLSEDDVRKRSYERNVTMLNNRLLLNYFKSFDISIEHWYDFEKKRPMEYDISVSYNHQCFIVTGDFSWDTDNTSYGLSFSLPGFWN